MSGLKASFGYQFYLRRTEMSIRGYFCTSPVRWRRPGR